MNALVPPPAPPWEGLHPLVVHFPIALLLVAPLFVVLGLLPRVGRGFSLAALALLVLGTLASYVAVATGEAACGLAVRTPEINAVIEAHEELAEASRTIYTLITLAYALVVIGGPYLSRKLPKAVPVVAQIVCLVAMLAGGIVLANAGHLGGRLVHDLGVRAWFGAASTFDIEHE